MSAFTLKIIASFLMLIDHTGLLLFPDTILFRIIGRLAFPIYAFFIVEGFHHTTNIRKYIGRLISLAVISEIPYNLLINGSVFYPSSQSIFCTLTISLLMLTFFKYIKELFDKDKTSYSKVLSVILQIVVIILSCCMAKILHVDYGPTGILLILIIELFRNNLKLQYLFSLLLFCLYSPIEVYAIGAFILLRFYNGKKGPSCKSFFYLFYPTHLLALWGIKYIFFIQ